MTTATSMSATKNPEAEFAYGSGHINPLKAYIVYMGSKPKGQLSTSALHMSMLRQVAGRFCNENSLDKNLVKGKIVLCDLLDTGEGPFYAGAVGTVIQDTIRRDNARNFPLPTSYVNRADGSNILIYIKSNREHGIAGVIRTYERQISLLSWLLLLTFSLFISQIASQDNRQAYIVYMGSKPEGQLSTSALHMSMLRQVAGRNFGPESLLYHYGKSFDGFVVKLTEEEAKKMAGMSGVVSGISINTVDLTDTTYPLIYGGDAPNVTGGFSYTSSRFCYENSLDKNLVKGKIVLCDFLLSGRGPFYAGAAGAVIQDTFRRDHADTFPLPTSYVNRADGSNILIYIKSNSNASATIFKSTQGNDTKAPYVVSFSSRGPNPITLDILKVRN
ncbi:hypothetical protein LWI29_026979 [Acer saccharum]|uniref:Inhibitor I9 domain-containing protein n=1 Tax=Acer saccharum TaxID=4024 RepID=A0AA39VU22_ACESA|nr:hypothetical protein LWI29_026979 [Acer saccharum]